MDTRAMLPFEELPKNYPYDLFRKQVEVQPYPLVFVTISGPHMFGLDTHHSTYQLRGVHVSTLKRLYGLNHRRESIEDSAAHDGVHTNLVTTDADRFFSLLRENDGDVLEQLFSPLVVHTTPEHEELRAIAMGGVSRRYARHYLSLAEKQWTIFSKTEPTKVEPLLHVYRSLLTGIHLMRTGEFEANLIVLNERAQLSVVDDLVDLFLADPTSSWLAAEDFGTHEQEYKRLIAELESAAEESSVPEEPGGQDALNDLLTRLGEAY